MARKRIERHLSEAEDEKGPLDDMPLESLADYQEYNREARKLNKKLRICRYHVKQCPFELHPKERVVLGRVDGQSNANPVPVLLVNEDIDYNETLVCGTPYDLPHMVVDHLEQKGYPIWDWVEKSDGSKETKIVGTNPRFTLKRVRVA